MTRKKRKGKAKLLNPIALRAKKAKAHWRYKAVKSSKKTATRHPGVAPPPKTKRG